MIQGEVMNEDPKLSEEYGNFKLVDRAVGKKIEGTENEYTGLTEVWKYGRHLFRIHREHPSRIHYFGLAPTTRVDFWNGEKWTEIHEFISTDDSDGDRTRALDVAAEVVCGS